MSGLDLQAELSWAWRLVKVANSALDRRRRPGDDVLASMREQAERMEESWAAVVAQAAFVDDAALLARSIGRLERRISRAVAEGWPVDAPVPTGLPTILTSIDAPPDGPDAT